MQSSRMTLQFLGLGIPINLHLALLLGRGADPIYPLNPRMSFFLRGVSIDIIDPKIFGTKSLQSLKNDVWKTIFLSKWSLFTRHSFIFRAGLWNHESMWPDFDHQDESVMSQEGIGGSGGSAGWKMMIWKVKNCCYIAKLEGFDVFFNINIYIYWYYTYI